MSCYWFIMCNIIYRHLVYVYAGVRINQDWSFSAGLAACAASRQDAPLQNTVNVLDGINPKLM